MPLLKRLFIFVCIGYLHAAYATGGMVVSEKRLASAVGAAILQAGGNAIDAAVAVGYALSVVDPCCGNIGGGGFMVIHLANGKNIFLNFREKAPLKATAAMYLDKQKQVVPHASTNGYLAVAVPGTVLGLDTALTQYGTMTRAQVMAPAIKLAEQGYPITAYDGEQFQQFANDFRSQANVAAIFLLHDKPYPVGSTLIQKDLANTLKLIAQKGPDAFYRGPIAKAIVEASNASHGILTLADFAAYSVRETPPLFCSYRGYDILSAPPPSAGGTTLCEMLNIIENFSPSSSAANDAEWILGAMHYAYKDRNSRLGDPDYVHNPVTELTSKAYAKQLAQEIRLGNIHILQNTTYLQEQTDTTHYSVVDSQGNAVAVTYTINGFFGARIMAGATGFFLNNEMDDFSLKSGAANKFGLVQSDTNNIQPGKRPLSSMTPVIVMKDHQVFLVLGSPGGPRIITAVLLTLLNVIDYHLSLQQAVDFPRFHYQNEPDEVFTEPFALPFLIAKRLQYHGYRLTQQQPWAAVEAIMVEPKTRKLIGANDSRRPDGSVAVSNPVEMAVY